MKDWIAGAIKHKGGLHKSLGIAAGKPIPKSKIEAAAKSRGKVGMQARLAETLEGFRKGSSENTGKGAMEKEKETEEGGKHRHIHVHEKDHVHIHVKKHGAAKKDEKKKPAAKKRHHHKKEEKK